MRPRRPIHWRWVFVASLIAAPLIGIAILVLLFFLAVSVSDSGSPELAAEWKAELLSASGPDDAATRHGNIDVLRCADGGWVIGKSQNSHGGAFRGGGTLVVRDSTGQVRTFFGHVCGYHFLSGLTPASVADFYAWLGRNGFTEVQFR